jgi:hypothetical protein
VINVFESMLREPFALQHSFPQRTLADCGFALIALTLAGFFWAWRDPRKVGGESVALKPIRFALSISVYMLTASAMFNYVRPERQLALLPTAAVWMMVIGSAIELSCIALQAARARQSHFNTTTGSDAAIFALMGIFAVLFVGALLPLAWEIARRPSEHADPTMVTAIVAGLLGTFFVGGGTGALMSSRGVHAVGKANGRLPLFGWNMTGGDIRAPHFFGIHAMQALPLMGSTPISRTVELKP